MPVPALRPGRDHICPLWTNMQPTLDPGGPRDRVAQALVATGQPMVKSLLDHLPVQTPENEPEVPRDHIFCHLGCAARTRPARCSSAAHVILDGTLIRSDCVAVTT